MANRYAGKTGLAYVSTSASAAATSVGQLTNWTMDFSTDKLDVTCFGDKNKQYVQSWGAGKGTLGLIFGKAQSLGAA